MEDSIRAINRIGDRLRDPALRLAALKELANYRKSFEAELSEVYSFSTSESVKIEHGAICVARFKRYATIESKLKRFPSMKLAQVQDIAGCRIIFESESSVHILVECLENLKDYVVRDRNDYIANPKNSGYRSYHLVLQHAKTKRMVEVQIRTRQHHNWATLVESTDLVFKTDLKERSQPDDFFKALNLLSYGDDQLDSDSISQLINFEKKYGYVRRFMQVFTDNVSRVEQVWRESKPNRLKRHFVIEVDSKGKFSLHSYISGKKAERVFLNSYLADGDTTSVLISLSNPQLESLVLAYSNYVLIGNEVLKRFYKLHFVMVRAYITKRKMFKVIHHYLDLLLLNNLEIDWSLAYLRSVQGNSGSEFKPSDFDNSHFAALMKARTDGLFRSARDIEEVARQTGDIYTFILTSCVNIFGRIRKRYTERKLEEIRRLLKG